MTKPRNFILHTGYATLKNDDKGSVSVNITTTGVLPYGSYQIFENFIDIGTVNAQIRTQMYRSGDPTNILATNILTVPVQVTVYYEGAPVYVSTLNLPTVVDRISPTRMRIRALFYSYGHGVSMQITGGAQTVTADIVTFLSPFN